MKPEWLRLLSWSMMKVCSEDSSEDSLRTVGSLEVEVTQGEVGLCDGQLATG